MVFVDPHGLQMQIVVSVFPHWLAHTHRNLDNFIRGYIMNSLLALGRDIDLRRVKSMFIVYYICLRSRPGDPDDGMTG